MNNYIPSPVNTDDVKLDPELISLTEMIAENVHDVWALGRINEGWVYGENRDNEKKTTPCLVPYDELPEAEKEYDRKTALETVKLIKKLGFHITRENPEAILFNLAKAYNDMASLYQTLNDPENAGTYYLKAIEIEEQIAENNNDLMSYLINTCNIAGNFFKEQGDSEKAEEMFQRAFDLCRKAEPSKDFDPDLATTCFNYGIFREKVGYLDKALEIAKATPDDPFCKAIIEIYGERNKN